MSRPLPGFPFNGRTVIGSREAMVLEKQPKDIIIIGAGAIGVEFAYFFNAFGTKVTLVEMMPNILPLEDTEVSQTLEKAFAKQGVVVADADLLAREVVAPGEPALAAVVERFGRDVLQADGQLDRAALRVRVFGDPDQRRALEAILHPAIRSRLEAICRALDCQPGDILEYRPDDARPV